MGRFDPALTVDWEELLLVDRDGEKVVVHTVEERLKTLCRCPSPDAKPIVVWTMDPAEYTDDPKPRWSRARDWPITFALERFRRFRIDVTKLPPGDVREQHRANLGFRWFDPAVGPVDRPLVGRLRLSNEEFSRIQGLAWKSAFSSSMKEYTDAMLPVFKRRLRNDSELRSLERRAKKLSKSPDAAALAKLDEDEKRVEAERKKIGEDTAALVTTVKVRPAFLPKPPREEAP